MHAIMDAERDATLAYLDELTKERGGRRGVAAVATETTGLVYATARHATTRAGDPGPHDHVLIANVIEMRDERGGTKAPDTTLWREHLHAATMVGRLASAKVRSTSATGSRPTVVRRASSGTGRLREFPMPRWRSTPNAPPRSTRPSPSAAFPPTRPARWPPVRPASKSATAPSTTWCPCGGANLRMPASRPASWKTTSSGPEYQRSRPRALSPCVAQPLLLLPLSSTFHPWVTSGSSWATIRSR
jgi:hypothetical protein